MFGNILTPLSRAQRKLTMLRQCLGISRLTNAGGIKNTVELLNRNSAYNLKTNVKSAENSDETELTAMAKRRRPNDATSDVPAQSLQDMLKELNEVENLIKQKKKLITDQLNAKQAVAGSTRAKTVGDGAKKGLQLQDTNVIINKQMLNVATKLNGIDPASSKTKIKTVLSKPTTKGIDPVKVKPKTATVVSKTTVSSKPTTVSAKQSLSKNETATVVSISAKPTGTATAKKSVASQSTIVLSKLKKIVSKPNVGNPVTVSSKSTVALNKSTKPAKAISKPTTVQSKSTTVSSKSTVALNKSTKPATAISKPTTVQSKSTTGVLNKSAPSKPTTTLVSKSAVSKPTTVQSNTTTVLSKPTTAPGKPTTVLSKPAAAPTKPTAVSKKKLIAKKSKSSTNTTNAQSRLLKAAKAKPTTLVSNASKSTIAPYLPPIVPQQSKLLEAPTTTQVAQKTSLEPSKLLKFLVPNINNNVTTRMVTRSMCTDKPIPVVKPVGPVAKRGRKKTVSTAKIAKSEAKITKAEAEVADIKANVKLGSSELSTEAIAKLVKLYPQPKNVLHNIYSIVAQQMQDRSLELHPLFVRLGKHENTMSWECTYHLKWPENLRFADTSGSKQEASRKAALLVLNYLKETGKITKDKQPVIFNEELEKSKSKLEALNISSSAVGCLEQVVESYEKQLMPLLVKSVEDGGDVREADIKPEWPSDIGKKRKMKFMGLGHYKCREDVTLPISEYKDEIINAIRNNQVVVIKGEPGCGKSTRVPQYVLEGWSRDTTVSEEPCRIIVTQPRRIAAISLAERVARERNEQVGTTVGYQVRLKSNFSKHTGNVLYCTTGILLRKLQYDSSLADCTHIILDEAHERDVNTDLLMNLLRHATLKNPHIKLVIMSATIDAEMFQRYFNNNAAAVHIPGFTYPVKQHFLDESKLMVKTMKMCEGANPSVVCEDVAKLIQFIHRKREEGAILCFLPGWEDIVKVRNLLGYANDLKVLCLHSRLQDAEQNEIFSKPPPGVRKVILSTNIAETSVTIDDVAYVIDSGMQKEKRFDVEKGVMCVDNLWISKASMAQRKGRAGRCKPGESFHLYPESKYNTFADYSLPEILRVSLTKIVLDSKVFSNNMPASEFLSQLPSPPEQPAILKAVDELKELELLDDDEKLTPLGRVLSEFQLEPNLGKAMVNAVIFKCVTPIVDVVTLFSAESEMFSTGLIDKESVNKCKREFSHNSDHLSMMRIFEKWLEYVEAMDISLAQRFCHENKLLDYKLYTIQKLREIHFDYLRKGLHSCLPMSDDSSDNDEMVKAVLLSGVGTVLQRRNYDIVKGHTKKANVLLTRNNHKATIASESVNSRRTVFPSNYLLYINETRSNVRRTTVVREASLISPLSVLLFKHNELTLEEVSKSRYCETIKSDDQVLLRLKDTKIKFICDRRQAEVILKSKQALTSAVEYYVYQLTKGADYNSELNTIWDGILRNLNEALAKTTV